MTSHRIPGKTAQRAFIAVAIATLVAAFAQVTLGGIVRVTGSGLGCPDWPLCHGRIIPPFDVATLLEYSHRLSASLLSLLILATTALAWRYYRWNAWILGACVAGVLMVLAAALLGGVTVITELTWWVRLFHLGIAQVVVAALVIATVAGWRQHTKPAGVTAQQSMGQLNRWVLFSVLGVFVIVLSGSYMVGYGAGSSCATWPLCRGSLFPEGGAYAVHMGHRYIAFLVGVLVLATAYIAWSKRDLRPEVGWAGMAIAATFLIQVMVGAATVWSGFSPAWKALHLSTATLVWMALIVLAALVYTPLRLELRVPERLPTPASDMERLSS